MICLVLASSRPILLPLFVYERLLKRSHGAVMMSKTTGRNAARLSSRKSEWRLLLRTWA